jgi:lysozyme family protein
VLDDNIHGHTKKHIQIRVNFWYSTRADNKKITSSMKRLEIVEDSTKDLWYADFTIHYVFF